MIEPNANLDEQWRIIAKLMALWDEIPQNSEPTLSSAT